ncbi:MULTISPECIES: helix-turn-helix domain-containing protein [unclassified Myroides]|uniref:helix-turn-helix domain-containing protein n=1 Tax=unclassified Myroides TaxID=2642485 RepID=UPI0015FDF2BE|nr:MULTISPECIES: helix-turn-helix domain-containing protein [unclassified Myroides]MBB1151179.1 AraC family transcriptional regulator [Myroides sp. NP-2]MDM1408713.1 AraC family transcriptional regulator [Myroides sp. DF42-4-2]
MTNSTPKIELDDIDQDLTTIFNINAKEFAVYSQKEGKELLIPYNIKTHYKVSYLNSKSKLFCGTETREFSGPILFFSNPLSTYTLEPTSESPDGFFCLFTNNFLGFKSNEIRSTLHALQATPIYALDLEQDRMIRSLFENIVMEHRQDYPLKQEILRNYVEIIIHQANKLKSTYTLTEKKNATNRLCAQFLELVEKQFPITDKHQVVRLKTATDFAFMLNVHTNYLNFVVKQTLGKPTTTIIQERILIEAQRLLKHSTMSVSEIAFTLGFEYATYFSSFVKKYTGYSPKQLRK